MWKWLIKMDNLIVARGQSNDKETAGMEALHYASQYGQENFINMIIKIIKIKE